MNWTELDWTSLDRLRSQFLSSKPSGAPYWASARDLADYDMTFGERIGWKWDAVLDELRLRGWSPPSRTLFDWGCGSGIAGRRVIRRYGPGAFTALTVWDHSPLANAFAHDAARSEFPGLEVSVATPEMLGGSEPIGLLVVSHVLNELPPAELNGLRALIARSAAVVWTEPGTHEASRALGALREELRETFRVVAPCTHGDACPVLAPANERHWCHFFGFPPPAIFADPNWVKFGQRAGIDLRSLPYSFVALDRRTDTLPPGLSRVIGRAEHFKPYARVLNCDSDGLAEIEVMKREHPALYKDLDRRRLPLVYHWTREGPKITAGAALQP